MNSQKIAAQLKKDAADSRKIQQLNSANVQRQAEIRSRLEAITPQPSRNPLYAEAVLAGPDEILELEAEAKALSDELSYLENLEIEAGKLQRRAFLDELRRDIPIALKKYPAALSSVREAIRNLDAAIGDCNKLTAIMGSYIECGLPHPLPDERLAELITVRNDLWAPRHLRVLFPDLRRGFDAEADDVGEYPTSWPLIFKVEEKYGARVVSKLRPSDMEPRSIGD